MHTGGRHTCAMLSTWRISAKLGGMYRRRDKAKNSSAMHRRRHQASWHARCSSTAYLFRLTHCWDNLHGTTSVNVSAPENVFMGIGSPYSLKASTSLRGVKKDPTLGTILLKRLRFGSCTPCHLHQPSWPDTAIVIMCPSQWVTKTCCNAFALR